MIRSKGQRLPRILITVFTAFAVIQAAESPREVYEILNRF
jgi:hypothetical protein